jgi:hypothetical protein
MGDPTEEPLVDLFRHHLWANLRLLDSCEGLSDAQLDATVHGTFGSIRATHRAHIMTIITQQGLEPPDVDGWAYVVANIPAEEITG